MAWYLQLLTLSVVMVTAVPDKCAEQADGCSIPLGLNFLYKKLFTPSCNRHDICYSCGIKYGLSRKACDDKFKEHMKDACNTLKRRRRRRRSVKGNPVNRGFCKIVVPTYYYAVRLGADSHYQMEARSFCDQPWVTSCF